ncbi:MAG TPA: alkaline phosphatase family protein [Acetobacteraceae bacterium]|nr:alkaline phosphatase family protein [Acetobacteraceae bacterium]
MPAPPEHAAPIEHIVVLMMENACFDRMLGCMAERHPGLEGVDPAHPRTNPDPDTGRAVAQGVTTSRNIDRDPKHYTHNSLHQVNGGAMDGFVSDFVRNYPRSTDEERREVMAYYPRGFLPALHTLAENFVVCDHWFSSIPGPTWANRLFAHSGTSLGHVEEPGILFTSRLHIYPQPTLYTEMAQAGVPWRIYYGDVPQSLVLLRQLEHLGNYRRFAHWDADIAAGDLPAYTFIEPTYFGPHQNDQHPPHDVLRGDELIAGVYNALRSNAALFAKTLLIVVYDEHGGFYDHLSPPATVAPDEHTARYAFDRLGVRVPAILVSPLLDAGVHSPVLDHTGLLTMASEQWPGVAPLGRRAAHARSPLAGLSWRSAPREGLPEAPVADDIQPVRPIARLEGFKESLFGFSHHLESRIDHSGHRSGLMARAHEALDDGLAQARLATDRVDAFIEEKSGGPGVLGRIEHAARDLRRKVGI